MVYSLFSGKTHPSIFSATQLYSSNQKSLECQVQRYCYSIWLNCKVNDAVLLCTILFNGYDDSFKSLSILQNVFGIHADFNREER